MEEHVILSSVRFRQIKGFVQTFEETLSNTHSTNVSFIQKYIFLSV